MAPYLLAGAVSIGAGLCPEAAWAQTTEDADDADAQAATLFERGLAYEQAEAWGEALDSFRKAARIAPTAEIQFHIAWCEESLGNPVAALGGYRLALAQVTADEAELRRDIEARIDTVEATIPKLIVQRGSGAATAHITLDGNVLGSKRIGTEIPVEPGTHTVIAEAEGYEGYAETFTVDGPGTTTIVVVLEQIPVAPAPTRQVEAAHHVAPADYVAPAEPDRTAAYTVGAIGGAGLVTAVGFLVARSMEKDRAEELCGGSFENCRPSNVAEAEESNEALEAAQTYTTLAVVSAGVGAAALGIMTLMLMTEEGHTHRTALGVAPSAPGAPAGMSVFGRF